jgi:3-oxoacyl-(acyl-carrier-protein) synthase
VILGSAAPTIDQPLDRLSTMLSRVRNHTGIRGPAYHVAVTEAGGAKALASADRMLRASLADAALVGGIDDEEGALLLIERHGEAFVDLRATAETTGSTTASQLDHAAAEQALAAAWHAGGRAPLGYVHVHTEADDPHAAAEREVIQALLGDARCCGTRSRLHVASGVASRHAGAGASAIDTVLAAASLARGYTPEPQPRELEHDRVLLHAFSPRGHHVALLLESRA